MMRVAGLDPLSLLVIALGSALGGAIRIGLELQVAGSGLLPAAALLACINISGGGLMGFVHQATLPEGRWALSPYLRQALLTGVLGGYTTFSVLSALAFLQLAEAGPIVALLNLYGSLLLAILAAWLGIRLGAGSAEDATTEGE